MSTWVWVSSLQLHCLCLSVTKPHHSSDHLWRWAGVNKTGFFWHHLTCMLGFIALKLWAKFAQRMLLISLFHFLQLVLTHLLQIEKSSCQLWAHLDLINFLTSRTVWRFIPPASLNFLRYHLLGSFSFVFVAEPHRIHSTVTVIVTFLHCSGWFANTPQKRKSVKKKTKQNKQTEKCVFVLGNPTQLSISFR